MLSFFEISTVFIHHSEHPVSFFKFPKYSHCILSHISQFQIENENHEVEPNISMIYPIKSSPASFAIPRIWQASIFPFIKFRNPQKFYPSE